MKRTGMVIILLLFLLTAVGCAGKEKTEETGKENKILENNKEPEKAAEVNTEKVKQETGVNTEQAENMVNLKDLSKELVDQMQSGDFDQTYELLDLITKAQMKKQDLKTAWDASVVNLGKYQELTEITEEKVKASTIVKVILKYENNGFRVTFTYNKAGNLAGLWLDYVTVEMKLEDTDNYSEAAIKIGEGDYLVDGILTLPKGVSKPPVVILVPGSGTHDWDETVGGNKPFRDIAHGLAEQGIATIRYQERLVMHTALADDGVTIQEDSLDDADQAIRYAVQSDLVDNENVFVLGHSLGGMLAPKIASEHKEVIGILCMAGSPRRLEDIIIDQQDLLLGISGEYTGEQIEQIMASTREQAEQVKTLKAGTTGTYLGMGASYWYSLNQINTPEILETLTIPMFIAQGNVDWQVYADKDYTRWQELLGDRENVTFRLYDKLNHLFMPSTDTVDMKEYETPSSVDRQVIDDMADWIIENRN